MPAMSSGDQWNEIHQLIDIEAQLRGQGIAAIETVVNAAARLTPFWADMARLLAIYALTKGRDEGSGRRRHVVKLQNEMSSPYYRTYIRRRHKAVERTQGQLELLEAAEITEESAGAAS